MEPVVGNTYRIVRTIKVCIKSTGREEKRNQVEFTVTGFNKSRVNIRLLTGDVPASIGRKEFNNDNIKPI